MEQQRKCPECGSTEYRFRGRKKIPAEEGKPEMMETTYRCQNCQTVWKARVPAINPSQAG